MATFSDGESVSPVSQDFANNGLSSIGDMRLHLQNLLDIKEKQLQQAGTLGQRILAQQVELEERIRQLQEFEADKGDDDDLDSDIRDRYRDLALVVKGWEAENGQLSSSFGPKHLSNGIQSTPRASDTPRDSERSKAGPSSAAQSRRAKNAAHRADDVEFAFEIGSGLLTEVRRLQSLLAERDKAIQDMKEEKDDLDKTIENLRAGLREQEQSSDKFKEENWNLEVTLQELRVQLSDSQASTQRLESEHKRLTKLLTAAREATDQHKTETERLKSSLDEFKAKHETDIAQARKQAASLQRDKSDLQQTVDSMKVEVARANRRLPRFGSPLTPNGTASDAFTPRDGDDDDVFSPTTAASTNRKKYDSSALFPVDELDYPDSSPDPSPLRSFVAPNHPNNEIEALQQRLAHAQRQINTLKGTLQREKELRIEYSRKLDGTPDVEGDEENIPAEELASRRLTPFRVGRGKGRGRGRGSFIQRLNQASRSPTSDFNDDEDPNIPPPVPSIPGEFIDREDDGDYEDEPEDNQVTDSPSLQVGSNRTSVDGMDPVFANILHRSSSQSTLPINGSPLRNSVNVGRGRGGTLPRRSRGGSAYQEPRPASLVTQPELLANELGLGVGEMQVVGEKNEERTNVETAEFGCQTEPEEPAHVSSLLPTPAIQISRRTSDMAIQAEPEPIPEVITVEMSMQTEAELVLSRSEVGTQHEAPLPTMVSTSVNTDEPRGPPVSQAEMQTQTVHFLDVETQTPQPLFVPPRERTDSGFQTIVPDSIHSQRRTTITQHSLAEAQHKYFSGENTVAQVLDTYGLGRDGDDIAETGPETDTDMDDYQDARASIVMSTPGYSASGDDFHSIMTVTDNELSETDEDEDNASIKAPYQHGLHGVAPSASEVVGRHSFYRPTKMTYESKAIETDGTAKSIMTSAELPPQSVEPSVPQKPETNEMSVQTEEWQSPTPPVSASVSTFPRSSQSSILPASPIPGFSLFRVGPNIQQFQFVSSQVPPSPGVSPVAASPAASPNTSRDSHATIMALSRSQSDRRQSIESTLSSAIDDLPRSRTSSGLPTPIDKSRPPMMVLPPPPKQPPPPSGSMPPPSFIPEKRISHDVPPPRPSSPPPPDLIQRATTPTFGTALNISGNRGMFPRQHGSSMPPSHQGMRQPASTSSFRSAANAAAHAQHSASNPPTLAFGRKEMSTTSLISGSLGSQRSSISSDRRVFADASNTLPRASADRMADTSGNTTDPTVIHAITQTMIGEFLYKYTRRTIGKGHGERRHKRFFWVHPYTKTLYWSSADPGSSNVSESSAKSAYIESVRSVLDPNPMPPGLYQYSVVVSTPNREMKITAPTKERHDIWLNALQYLLSRPGTSSTAPGENGPLSPMSVTSDLPDEGAHGNLMSSPQSHKSGRSARTAASGESWVHAPKGQRNRSQPSLHGSLSKRSGTPAAEYLRLTEWEAAYSPTKSYEQVSNQDEGELDFELHDGTLSDEGYEGLENVRACCDGRHTVGHHHHHHEQEPNHNSQRPGSSGTRDRHLDVNAVDLNRPVSPAWSFRSRGSANSKDGHQSIFSRFGSRRSTKTQVNVSGS